MANVILRRTSCRIQYQLKLSGFGQKKVADLANCSVSMISHFLRGRKDSARVRTALCKVLGYGSFDRLIAASREQAPPEGDEA
ncbi:MAG: helix-turn-helix domain-containing protein [Treponema sp.]|jgi:transcriptional regulator with XRE-family HTH domain|nr:helix-turn-helix domain-containing protein [Treponema sp.]